MKTTLAVLALVFSLTACAPAGAPPETASTTHALDPIVSSGSRIQTRVKTTTYTTIDGATYTYRGNVYFYDTVLDHRCEIIEAGAALGWRCLPTADATIDGAYPGNPDITVGSPGFIFASITHAYSDSSCSHLVAALYDPTKTAVPSKTYARISGDTLVYGMAREVTPWTLYFKGGTGPCTSAGGAPGSDWRLFEVTGPLTGFAGFAKSESVEVL